MSITVDRVYQVPGASQEYRAECGGSCHRGVTATSSDQAWRWLDGHHDLLILPVLAAFADPDSGEPLDQMPDDLTRHAVDALLQHLPDLPGFEVHPLSGTAAIGAYYRDPPNDVADQITRIRQALLGTGHEIAVLPMSGDEFEQVMRGPGARTGWQATVRAVGSVHRDAARP